MSTTTAIDSIGIDRSLRGYEAPPVAWRPDLRG